MSYAICEQQRRRSACASAQSDHRLCCSLPRQNDTSIFYIRNFKILADLSVAEQVSLCLAWSETPEDTFSHGVAHLFPMNSDTIVRDYSEIHARTDCLCSKVIRMPRKCLQIRLKCTLTHFNLTILVKALTHGFYMVRNFRKISKTKTLSAAGH